MQPTVQFQPDGSSNNPPTCSTQIAVTTTVQTLTLPATLVSFASIRLVVAGTANIAWCYGVNSALTTGNGVVMLPNTVEVFAVPPGVTQISVIGAAAGTTLIASIGVGQ